MIEFKTSENPFRERKQPVEWPQEKRKRMILNRAKKK